MGDANRTQTGFVLEQSWGVIPTNPTFETIRVTSNSLKANPKTITSDEITVDGQVKDLILVGMDPSGPIGQELSYGGSDTFIQVAMRSAWQTKPKIVNPTADSNITDVGTIANTIAVASALGSAFKVGHLARTTGLAASANNQVFRVTSSTATTIVGSGATFTADTAPAAGATVQVVGFAGVSGDIGAVTSGGNGLTSSTLDFTTLGLNVGEWLKPGGTATGDKFATAANNDWCRISGITANKISFDIVPTGWTADTGTGKTIKVWMGDYIRNGTTEFSGTMEEQFQDQASPSYKYTRGLEIDEMVFTFDSEKQVTVQSTFVGKDILNGTVRQSGATDLAAPTNDIMNCASDVGRLAIGGTDVAGPNFIMHATISLKRNLRGRKAVKVFGSASIGSGEVTVTGDQTSYYGDTSIYNAVLANSASSFDIRVAKSAATGQTMLFDVPKTKYSDGDPDVTGKNTDVMLPAKYQGLKHAVLGYSIHIARYPYVEN